MTNDVAREAEIRERDSQLRLAEGIPAFRPRVVAPIRFPKGKPVESRHQTKHKLETTDRWWRTWCRILAQASAFPFCNRHLWLVDTMAGSGLHGSISDLDRVVPGTPVQALNAARATQAEFPGVIVHVRAIDSRRDYIAELEAIFAGRRGVAPHRVDATTFVEDWRNVVDRISAEITGVADHEFQGQRLAHQHRSLWLIDPFGVEPLDFATIDRLPAHAEVVVNFDGNAVRRHAGKNLELLGRVYRDDRWRAATTAREYAEAFAEQFPRWGWPTVHPLWPSGSQDRFLVHLASSKAAVAPFKRAVDAGVKAGTLASGDLLDAPGKHKAAANLAERFHSLELSIDEMYAAGTEYSRGQLRIVAAAASDLGYGSWNAKMGRLTWWERREAEPTLGL
jgi:three-Cys-motif partner protein